MTFGSAIAVQQMVGPAGTAGDSLIYPKSDGKWYTKNGTGSEVPIGGSPFTENRIGLRGPSTDSLLFTGIQTSVQLTTLYVSGDMSWDGNPGNYFLTIPTAGVYTFTWHAMFNGAGLRRQVSLEKWTGSTPTFGGGQQFVVDDRYVSNYSVGTCRATESMAAGARIRPLVWVESGTSGNTLLGSFMPARLDVRRIL